MDPTSPPGQIQVSTSESTISKSGFTSIDNNNLTFTKKITVGDKNYTIAITFKPEDSEKQKEAFLKHYGDNAEKVIKIAVNLGLGAVKAPTENKPTRNYIVTAINFQSDKDGFKASKTKTSTDGTPKTSTPTAEYKSKEDDAETKKTRHLEKNKNLDLMRNIYNTMKDSSNANISDQTQNKSTTKNQSNVLQKVQPAQTSISDKQPVENSNRPIWMKQKGSADEAEHPQTQP
ncbi:MAG: hypothetical protein H0W50_00775 [Parachlamydiaceae bacterium]|nr:hypothetical protein [Parachlamydiaceae bacterium]